MKKYLSLAIVFSFLLSPLLSVQHAHALAERGELLKARRELMRALREEDKESSQLSELKEELESVQEELEEIRTKRAEEYRENRKRALVLRRLKNREKFHREQGNASSDPSTAQNDDSATKEVQTGQASYYADRFNGQNTASGETFSNSLYTAAHRMLPFGTRVRVTNLANGNTVEVRINDRGPYVDGRIIDLSSAAFLALDSLSRGVLDVKVEVLD